MVHLHFRMKFDENLLMEEIYKKIGVPFAKALLEEIHTAFNMPSTDPTETLYLLNPVDIPKKNLAEYDNEKLEILFDFYGKPLQGSYEDRAVVRQALINCTQESLALEYKEYVISQRNELSAEFSCKRKHY